MTIVAAIETKEGTHFGCDAAGSSKGFIASYKQKKIFRNGPFIFGVSGSFRLMQIIQWMKIVDDGESLCLSKFVLDLKAILRESEMFNGDSSESLPGSVLFSMNGKLYEMQNDWSILRSEAGYSAIGSGDAYVYGSFFSTERMDPKERIRIAMKASAKYDPNVQGPFHFLFQAKPKAMGSKGK